MSLGQTASAPASAWLTAVRASSSSVASLSTSSPSSAPQWPCEVYSQRQTSVISTSPGEASRSARSACCTTPSSSHAPDPSSSFSSGIPNRRTARTPSRSSSWASAARPSTACRPSAGKSGLGSVVGPTKSGKTKSSRSSRVSRTSARRRSLRRSRRRRVAGKLIPTIYALTRGRGRRRARRARRARPPASRPAATGSVVERRVEEAHRVDERQRVAHPAGGRARPRTGRGRGRRSAARRVPQRARPCGPRGRASRAARRARRATPPARTSPSTTSGSRRHGSPPLTPPTSMISPKTTAIVMPRASASAAASATFAQTRCPSATSPRASRPITFSSRSAASAPAASSSARKVIVSASAYACTLAESSRGPAPALRVASSIGCAVAASASPVFASASAGVVDEAFEPRSPRGVAAAARAPARPARGRARRTGCPSNEPLPPCRISVDVLQVRARCRPAGAGG